MCFLYKYNNVNIEIYYLIIPYKVWYLFSLQKNL